MNIYFYIHDLLYQDDCVIVPNLGAFVARRINASFDQKRGLFLPERKEILFNQDIHHNDGVLANLIAEKEKISFLSALKAIDDFAISTREKLTSGDVCIFPSFGSMKMIDSRIVFCADNSDTFLPSTYGLKPVSATERVIEHHKSKVPYVAASVLFLCGLFLVSPETKDVDHQNVVSANFSQIITHVEPEVVEETVEVIEPQKNYHIIVASFTNMRDAKNYINSHNNNYEVLKAKNKYRISAGRYSTKEEAQKEKNNYSKSWIYLDR